MNSHKDQRMWAKILLVAAVALVMLMFALATAPAQETEHPPASRGDPYTGINNPVHGFDCCHGMHCAPLPPNGWKVRTRADGVKVYDFNHRNAGVWYSIPVVEAEGSFDHRAHSCVLKDDGGDYRACLLLPGAT